VSKIKNILSFHGPYPFPPVLIESQEKDEEEEDEANTTKTEPTLSRAENMTPPPTTLTEGAEMENQENPGLTPKNDNPTVTIWARNLEDITQKEYAEYYKGLTNASEDHLAVKHFHFQRDTKFQGILFVPRHNSTIVSSQNAKTNIQLYSQKKLVAHGEDLLPAYLSFIRGEFIFI